MKTKSLNKIMLIAALIVALLGSLFLFTACGDGDEQGNTTIVTTKAQALAAFKEANKRVIEAENLEVDLEYKGIYGYMIMDRYTCYTADVVVSWLDIIDGKIYSYTYTLENGQGMPVLVKELKEGYTVVENNMIKSLLTDDMYAYWPAIEESNIVRFSYEGDVLVIEMKVQTGDYRGEIKMTAYIKNGVIVKCVEDEGEESRTLSFRVDKDAKKVPRIPVEFLPAD